MQLTLFRLLLLTEPLNSSEQHTRAYLEFSSNFGFSPEGLKAFLSLSFPRVILGDFGKKPFPEFLKAFPDLESV